MSRSCKQFVNVNSVLEFMDYWDASRCLTKTSRQGTFFLNLLSLVLIVDKLEIFKDVHEINDITIDTNLVLASDVTETKVEAFEEEDDVAVRDSDQESRGNTAKILLGSVMV